MKKNINLSGRNLTVLPDLSGDLDTTTLNCSENKLTSLENLPPNLDTLLCDRNQITSLGNLLRS